MKCLSIHVSPLNTFLGVAIRGNWARQQVVIIGGVKRYLVFRGGRVLQLWPLGHTLFRTSTAFAICLHWLGPELKLRQKHAYAHVV